MPLTFPLRLDFSTGLLAWGTGLLLLFGCGIAYRHESKPAQKSVPVGQPLGKGYSIHVPCFDDPDSHTIHWLPEGTEIHFQPEK